MKRKMCKLKISCLLMTAIVGILLSACASDGSKTSENEAASQNAADVANEAAIVQLPEIGAPTAGKAYDINDMCHVLETYEQYNIQVPDTQMAEELLKDGYQGVTFKSHTVAVADNTTSEGGKYDVVDAVVVEVEGADPLGILPQTIEKTVTYKRDVATSEWIITGESCKKWKINHKKLGGTAWKKTTAEGDVYIRLRDTLEFFYTNVDPTLKSTELVDFETTIMGVLASEKDGGMMLERIHILSGTVTDTGIITLKMEVYDDALEDYKEETLEMALNDFEQIEKEDLPFSEEEFREVSAW